MLWTDIQQSVYSTNNYNNVLSPSSASLQAAASLKQQEQPYPYHYNVRTGSISSSTKEEEDASSARRTNNLKRKSSLANEDEDNSDQKRKNFLERNRQAALKCRQRKKQWLHNLQERVEYLANDNEQLQLQVNVMKDEVLNLRKLLMLHKDCHISKTGVSNKVLMTQQQQLPTQQLPQLPLLQQLPPQQQPVFTNNTNIAASAIAKNALINVGLFTI